MNMSRSSTLTIKHQNVAQPSIVGKYVGGGQLRDPHRGAGGAGLRSRLGRGLGRLPAGLAMVLRVLLEWRPTAFHQHWVLQGRPSADDQDRAEFRISQFLDAVGCDPRGMRLYQCSIQVQHIRASHERRPHHEGHAALSGHQQTPDTADD